MRGVSMKKWLILGIPLIAVLAIGGCIWALHEPSSHNRVQRSSRNGTVSTGEPERTTEAQQDSSAQDLRASLQALTHEVTSLREQVARSQPPSSPQAVQQSTPNRL